MKEKKNIPVLLLILYLILIGSVILFYTSLKLEIEKKAKEKTRLEEILSARKNENTVLLVESQRLKAEDRIVPIAESRLGLEKYITPNSAISINKDQINQVVELINSKYE
jgi:hypothetical protein